MILSAGVRLGPYEVLAPIGAGGMGEVYKAKDTRLGRDVAVKVLPAGFASDLERLRRFEQEARAAAALNHPNILVLYDIGSAVPSLRGAGGQACREEERSDDVGEAISPHEPRLPRPRSGLAVTEEAGESVHYIVTELLEGESLRQTLRSGPLPPTKVVDFGVQIAQGLGAAHEKGIIHRDLKPENVFLTKDGRIKILDFGLARLRPLGLTAEESQSEAPTADTPTREGRVLGTPGYMAPEQVRGQAADARSDLFAFGCVLYEMLAGKRAFEGTTATDVAAAILKEDPPPVVKMSSLPRTTHEALPREGAGRALPLGARPGLRPRRLPQDTDDRARSSRRDRRQGRPPLHRRPALRQPQRRSRAGVLLRRDGRGDPQRAGPRPGAARRHPDLGVRLQGPDGGRPGDRPEPERRRRSRRQRAKIRQPAPHHRAAHQRVDG